ncbi:endonuclease/exonuclease/phosphatase family protein [Aliihoeflea sp. PC F10.4]
MRGSLLLRLGALCLVAGTAGAISLGYLGWLHPGFDSFSHFRVHLAALLIIAVLPLALFRYWPEAIFAALLGIGALWSTLEPPPSEHVAEAGEQTAIFRLFHLNLRYDSERPDLVLSAIGEQRPDVVTLTEVSENWRGWLRVLEGTYPYQIVCPPPSRIGGVAILSRRPLVSDPAEACGDRGSYARVDIDFAGRQASVAALHLGWPWPFGQDRHLPFVEEAVSTLDDTALLAGDFNAVPWSRTVRRVAEAGGLDILRGIGATYLDRRLPSSWLQWIGLPIDHVLVKGGVEVRSAKTLAPVGSDHLPILVEFSLAAQSPRQLVEFAARR